MAALTGGVTSPDAIACSYSSRVNQRASPVSSPSTRISVLSARALNATIRDAGNGHGWEPRYFTSPSSMPVSSRVSLRQACSRFSPASTNPADTEYMVAVCHARLCCSSKRSCESTTETMTAGSMRGNSSLLPSAAFVQRCAQPPSAGLTSAPHVGQCRCRICHTLNEAAVVACPASRAEACGANPRRSTQSKRFAACSSTDGTARGLREAVSPVVAPNASSAPSYAESGTRSSKLLS